MMLAGTIERDLVLIGGGHAHVAVIKGLAMHPIPGMRLTVLSRDVMASYSGMLPGFLAGHYTFEDSHIDLMRLCRFAGARLYHSAATGIDTQNRQIFCASRPPLSYDLLSVDIGSTPTQFGMAGADKYAIAIKPADVFLDRLARLQEEVLIRDAPFHIVIIGGGAGGTELCLSLRNRLRTLLAARGKNPGHVHFSIVSQSEDLLPQHAATVVKRIHRVIGDSDIDLHLMRRVTEISATQVTLSDASRLPCDAAILATHASAPQWLASSGLTLDARGFIRVSTTLQSVSHPGVFAAGDIASMDGHRLAKSGVYAVRQGPVLLRNLRRAAHDKPLHVFQPQPRTLALISTGAKHAIASYGNFSLDGKWVWRLKDRIDRRWMKKYQQLPDMPDFVMAEADPTAVMPCGGCASKIPADILQTSLREIIQEQPSDIIVGLGAPDDAAVLDTAGKKLLVQTADQFRTFTDDPYLFAQITANHCLNDIYAMGADPHSALAMVTLPFGAEEKLQTDLRLILQGAMQVFSAAGVTLIGGHTATGAEMTLGFTLNGFADDKDLLRKGGALPWDALILTKPLGTGTLLAADMRAKSHAVWQEAATAMMLRSNKSAVKCLMAQGVTACTDVSGFGLAGHLAEMLRASKLSASVDLNALPALRGALESMAAGIFSTLHPANQRNAETLLDCTDSHRAHGHFPLLFDPQTAGGLLASVPHDKAAACITALRAAGYNEAAIIGATRPRERTESGSKIFFA